MFPPVLKNEKPSDIVLKYMDGLAKRSGKLLDACPKKHCYIVDGKNPAPPDIY